MKKLYSKFLLGDMQLAYITDNGLIGMCLFTGKSEVKITEIKTAVLPIAEVKLVGEPYSGSYFGGTSMKGSPSSANMTIESQEEITNDRGIVIKTVTKDKRNRKIIHSVTWETGAKYLRVSTEFVNESNMPVTLEMLSSFALYGISPYLNEDTSECLVLHRARSKWSMEGRMISEPFEDLLLEESWCLSNANSLRFGQVGSMPTKGYFPFAAIEDTKSGIFWGAQLYAGASWQMEITRADYRTGMSGGLADREFGHWTKKVAPGESFRAIPAVITICDTGLDDLCDRLVSAQVWNPPACEREMPIIFNEYCSSWGNPSYDKITAAADKAASLGAEYFVIDCGWFKKPEARWDISMGDYEPSEELFPSGIDAAAKYIRSKGMKAGIWFEPETIGRLADAYNMYEHHMLKRDGVTLTTVNRRFWNMNDEWVKDYLHKKVTEFLKKNGFEYIKIDYNDTIGIGCDDPDSLGEGLRKNIEGTKEFFRSLRREMPELIIENCASGGNRLEPSFMELSSMASFSDAHECAEIPLIAANLHRLIRPSQSQIWCVIRKDDTLKRIHYSMSAAMLGRMCLSGDITELDEERESTVREGIDFYRAVSVVIRDGKSKIIRDGVSSYRRPKGWQCVIRECGEYLLAVAHTFDEAVRQIGIPIGSDGEIVKTYINGTARAGIDGRRVWFNNLERMDSACVLIKLSSQSEQKKPYMSLAEE